MTIALSAGIDDAATQRAIRALERAIVAANASIAVLQTSSSGGGVPTSRLINTVAPLVGGGSLAFNLTLSVSAFGSANSGVVPGSGGGTVNFLRADGTWAAPSSGGVPTTRTLTTTAPLTIDGGGSADLSANRTLAIAANGIGNALFRQSAATSVVGNSTGSTANAADIVAGANSTMLVRSGGSLLFSDIGAIVAAVARGFFGDGYDGAINFDGTSTITLPDGTTIVPSASVYTLTRDIFATTIAVGNGVTILGKGFWLFANVSITGAGTALCSCNGGAGGAGTTAGGAAGLSASTTSRFTSAIGGGGGAGGTTGAGAAGGTNQQLNPIKTTTHGQAMSGGNGGAGISAGGNGATQTEAGGNSGGFRNWAVLVSGRLPSGTQLSSMGGNGGGGGGGTTSVGGGGGGGGGGHFGVFAPVLLGVLKLQCKGGDGGAGLATGNSGGGGGGSGGRAIYMFWSGSTNLTVDVSGGAGGARGGTGVVGEAGGIGDIVPL